MFTGTEDLNGTHQKVRDAYEEFEFKVHHVQHSNVGQLSEENSEEELEEDIRVGESHAQDDNWDKMYHINHDTGESSTDDYSSADVLPPRKGWLPVRDYGKDDFETLKIRPLEVVLEENEEVRGLICSMM